MDLVQAADNVASDYQGGPAAMAAALGINYTTFMHQLAETGTAKLGLRTAGKMSRQAKDPRILFAFCELLGYEPPRPMLLLEGEAGAQCMERMAEAMREFSDVLREVSARAADGDVSDNDMAVIRREWSEHVAAGARMMAHLEAMNQASPTHLREVRAA